MSIPALRKPKIVPPQPKTLKTTKFPLAQYFILTLKDNQKLVVTSDAYHGIVTDGNKYLCVFCHTEMELDSICKENHKNSPSHNTILRNYPHVEGYSKNLIRDLTNDSSFCTICNAIIRNISITCHLTTEVHLQELEKAATRAATYKPLKQ